MKRKSIDKQIIKTLKEFNEIVNANLTTVTEYNGNNIVTRKATDQDRVEFIKDEWYKVTELLDEMGIDI